MFKLITPFRLLFNLDSSKVAAQPALFVDFLKKAQAALDDPANALAAKIHPALAVSMNVPNMKDAVSDNARDHSRFYLLPHVMTLGFRPSYLDTLEKIYSRASAEADEKVAKYAAFFKPDLETLKIRVNDNTVATLALDLHIAGKGDGWEKINAWGSELVRCMLREIYPEMVFPLLKELMDFSATMQDRFVCDISEYKIFFVLVGDPDNPYPDMHKRFIPMKTNVTLCLDEKAPRDGWAEQVVGHGSVMKLKGAEVHTNDENNVILLSPQAEQKRLEEFWDVVAAANYYYVAMNVISVNLIRYIGVTSDRHGAKSLRTVSRDIENIINSVTILKVRYRDLSSELAGPPKKTFHLLQKEWNIEHVADNMQCKLDFCRANVKILGIEMQRRNQGRIETVLTGVAGVGVIGVFIDLSTYAVQLPPESRDMVGDIPGFMDLGFMMSANALSWVAIAIAAIVLIFTVRHRSG